MDIMKRHSLNNASIGSRINIGKLNIKVTLSQTGCKGCAFETEQGARFCQYNVFCFAHQRDDKQSVKFIKVEKI